MSLLEVKNVTKRFGGLIAVNDLSFNVDEKKIVSIIGPNGAGKTTVFNLITGIYKVDEGEIIFDGKPIHVCSPQQIVRAGIARTFQNIRLYGSMRVIENVLIGCHINEKYNFADAVFRTRRFRDYERRMHQKALNILDSLSLESYADECASNLPYGLQRKVEIARAIATDAKLLILDEPAAGMNPQESEELMNFIFHLRDLGYTILLIEHDMNLVMRISDYIYVCEFGNKIAEGVSSEISSNPRVMEAYLGKGGLKK